MISGAWCHLMRALIAAVIWAVVSPDAVAQTTVHDGDSLTMDGIRYRLDGIDAPERDQLCLGEKGEKWVCGIESRDRLREAIGNRKVACDDKGPDPVYPGRRIGQCRVQGEPTDLHQWIVREGWALNFEPYARGRFKADQDDARANRRGLWKGCFSTPQDFRRGNKGKAQLFGSSCLAAGDKLQRDLLFPDDPTMPPGCPIKAKFAVRAKITGHVGIYHLEGCRSYQRTKLPDRWFCSEDDAQAAGFRRAYTC